MAKLSKHYAQALFDLTAGKTQKEQENVSSSLVSVLDKKGHKKLLPGILEEFKRIEEEAKGKDSAVLTLAKDSDAKRFKKEINSFLKGKDLDEQINFNTKIDDTLIGGFRFVNVDTIIDGSYKRHLLNLYRSITS